jgi:hemerythrin superfamily protein
MDALVMLEEEHDDLKALLTKLARADGAPARHLFVGVKTLLALHEELEQTYFYPQLRQDEAARELALEAYEEHHVIDLVVVEISELKPKDEAWSPKVKVLKELVERHIDEEEQLLFPRVQDIWDSDKRRHVGRWMEELKARRKKELELTANA